MSDHSRLNFWQELRRRRVYRLAGFYIVGAWLVIQVADISFPAWGVPDTALRYLFIAAAACFPIALIFSWYYDVTSKGIVRTEAASGSEPVDLKLRRADYLVLTALLAVGLAILLGSANKIQEEIELAPTVALKTGWRENSIAVLPFTNLDINADTGFFSDGITEEILHRLSTLGALHVLASNSSFAFRESKESPSQIREKLGVRYLLQGSIRRENDFVRITARLIDEGGFQIWSESFERKLEGIFAIQTEIASTVASQIIDEIVPLQELPAGRTTDNAAAYNEYLVGKAYFNSRAFGWHEIAEAAFRRAIELDPQFAPAHAGLAMSLYVMQPDGSLYDEALSTAQTSVQLDPELASGQAILGLILSEQGHDIAAGIQALRRAIEIDASMAIAYNWLANALLGEGLLAESLAALNRGLEIDPLNPPLVANVSSDESRQGNFERAEQLLLRLVNIPDPPPLVWNELYRLYDSWGRFPDAIAIAKQALGRLAPRGNPWALAELTWGYANLGMVEDADYWKEIALDIAQNDLEMLHLTYNLLRTRSANTDLGTELQKLVNETEFVEDEHSSWTLAQLGMVNIQVGNYETGAEQLEYGLRLYQGNANDTGPAEQIDVSVIPGPDEDIAYVMHLLAFTYQQLGQRDKADTILQSLTKQFGMEDNALHYALMGDAASALRSLRDISENGAAFYYGPSKYYAIINSPEWAETIKAPEFQALLAEMKDEVDRQRAIVEAVDAEHDFRAEFEQLTAN